ncbi:MAG TPA: branched-chain amino acid ABC transporter permease/ATP-binding protein [Baekduia sp.]|nr:branched-chain amino acid ABC transporter permease/ATP-binding protein [Baekduia sp.]
MTQFFQYALLGLGAGAVYVLLAQGVVLIFRGSGVLNLAQGAFSMLAAYEFNDLHAESGWPLTQAAVVVVLGTASLGLLVDVVIMRRLRRASPLARVIATLGVLIVASSFAILRWGSSPSIVLPIITPEQVTILGATVTADRLWMTAIAILITGALVAVWRFTRVGWIAEAVSENETGAAALGWSPQVVSAVTWAAGGALAGLAGILIAPITQLNQSALTFLVVPALAATLVGGFRSFGLTLAGGLTIGMAQSLTGQYVHVSGAADALPFLLIVGVLIMRGSPLPLRGHVLDRMPSVGLGRVNLGVAGPAIGLGGLVVALASGPNLQATFATTLAIGIVLLSLVVLVGYAGQLSLAQYALAGLGALIAARLTAAQGWPFELALVAGVLGAMLIGLVFALPALRTRGVNLAVVTLGLGLAVQSVIFNDIDLTGGISGTDVGPQSFLGLDVDPITHAVNYSLLVFVFFCLACLLVAAIRRSHTGRQMLAVRSNERAAASSGVNVLATKLFAFATSGALAGLGGILLAFQSTTVTFSSFDPLSSINAVAQVVVGGVGYVLGALFGAVLAPQSLASLIQSDSIQRYLPLIGGIGVLATLMSHPDGVVAAFVAPLRKLSPRLNSARQSAPLAAPAARAVPVPPRTLVVEDLSVRYGGVVAVDGVNLRVEPGQVVALIGPNGAGKTSLMDGLTGFTPSLGRVMLDDVDVAGLAAHRRASAGMARSWQGLELFDDLTVLENLQVAGDAGSAGPLSMLSDVFRRGERPLSPGTATAVREFGLEEHLLRYPDELSYGQRRLVAIARAAAMEPSVLLLDEPAAGLDVHESAALAHLVRGLADTRRMALLVIEHDMDFVMGIADHIVVIDFGRQVAEGVPDAIATDPAAIASYLGTEAGDDSVAVLP